MKRMIFMTLFLFSSLGLAEIAKTENTLEKSFQRELAYLSLQKRQLEKRSLEIDKLYSKQLIKSRKSVKNLQVELLNLTRIRNKLNLKLTTAEKNLESYTETQALLESTLDQANKMLGIANPETNIVNNINNIFQAGLESIEKKAGTRVMEKSFFLSDGAKVKGKVLVIGENASFALTPKKGSLLPIGGGQFKLKEQGAEKTHAALLSKKGVVELYLYEGEEKALVEGTSKTVLDIIKASGFVGYIILFVGLIVLIIGTVRIRLIKKFSAFDGDNLQTVHSFLEKGKKEDALKASQTDDSSLGRIVSASIESTSLDPVEQENKISEAIITEITHYDRFGVLIVIAATVAPLLGLLGTVSGMISTFDIITEFGTGDPKLLSTGISEALITTKLGLLVAIPSLFIGNLLSGWANRIKMNFEKEALGVINISTKESMKQGLES